MRRSLIAGLSVVGHLAVLLVLFPTQAEPPRAPDPEPMIVALVEPPRPPEPPAPPSPAPEAPAQVKAKATPAPAKPPPRRNIFRASPVRPHVVPLPAGEGPTADGAVELSDAEIGGAATAGSGGSGRACDMTRWLQTALRKDRLVQAAVADAHRGKAILVWNGDWIRHPGQEGSGLAAVREALMWEIAFAPEACRAEPVRGLVLVSLGDAPGSARLVLGAGEWRWSDLLFQRGAAQRR